jgi:spoIIIJ-associated protein
MEEYIQDIIRNLLTALDAEFGHIQIDLTSNMDGEEEYYCNVETKNPSLLIGKNGQNMIAIQQIVKLILLKRTSKSINILLDFDGYRTRQKESTIGMVERHIAKVLETGKPIALPSMSPYFRRIVHLHIAENHPQISTQSKGYGDHRHIVINKKENV